MVKKLHYRKKYNFSSKFKPVFLIIIPLFITLVASYLFKDILNIKSVVYKVDGSCTSKEEIEKVISVNARNILTVDNGKIEEDTIKKIPCIKSVKVFKKLPNSLEIQIESRVPVALLKSVMIATTSAILNLETQVSSESATALDYIKFENLTLGSVVVDDTGFVFSDDEKRFVAPLIYLNDSLPKISQFAGKNIKSSLLLYKKLKELSKAIKEMVIFDQKSAYVKSGSDIFFNLEKDIDRQVALLQLLEEQAIKTGALVKKIDLRFDKPVVVTIKKSS